MFSRMNRQLRPNPLAEASDVTSLGRFLAGFVQRHALELVAAPFEGQLAVVVVDVHQVGFAHGRAFGA